jgi:predicted Fe-Mo cluster-binding NifX family protein
MILAIATWNGRVSPVFDVSRRLTVFHIENGVVMRQEAAELRGDHPDLRASQLSRMAVDTLICGAVSQPLAGMVTAYGIQVIPFVAGNVDEVMTSYLTGAIEGPNLAMPGCRRRLGRRGRGSARRQHQSIQERSVNKMPQGDGTGPDGNGPRKGSGAGQGGGRGGGRGQGQGKGRQGSQRDADPNSKGGNRPGGGGKGKGRGRGRGQNK